MRIPKLIPSQVLRGLRRIPTPPYCLKSTRETYSSIPTRKQNRLPATYYRGGTSRAIIFRQQDLPNDRREWDVIFCGVIGSPDVHARQLDGLGGGISSLSKVCVVGPSTHPEADVDYTFAAIGINDLFCDYSSNCGNMTSSIGPFAVDTGLVVCPEDGKTTVRIHNTNTGKLIHSTFSVADGEAVVTGSFAIDGVAGTAAKIELAFINPAGSRTGKLLPTGNTTDMINGVRATLIDAGNPCVFIQAKDVDIDGTMSPEAIDSHPTLLSTLDSIRRRASVAMGISKDEASTPGSVPKIAFISAPKPHRLLSGESMQADTVDLVVRALSVGQPHKAVPITVALALAEAARLEGSIVHANVRGKLMDPSGITVAHPSGKIMVGAKFDKEGSLTHATVFRTARRLMDGMVYWK